MVFERLPASLRVEPATIVVAMVILAVPQLFGWTIGGEVLVLAVFALGYNLLLGYGGLLSLGHAAFFGVGAYGTMIIIEYVVSNIYVAMAVATVAAGIVGLVFAVVSLRRRGLYFAMITLALAQSLYFVAIQWTDLTGGRNGLGIPLSYSAPGPIDPVGGGIQFFVVAVAALVVVGLVVRRIIRSPFGLVLVAIRENEQRARNLGYETDRYLQAIFVISSLFSGFAGALYAVSFGFVTPDLLFWLFSGEILLITLMGGIGTFLGPVVGVVLFLGMQESLLMITENWNLVFGLLIMLLVLFAPDGVYGRYLAMKQGGLDYVDLDSLRDRLGR